MKKTIFEVICASAGALTGFLFGETDGLFYALIAFVILDYITGVITAVIDKNLSSEAGFKGICRKILLFIIVAVANIVDVHIIKSGSALRTAVLFLFIANEGVSLLENAAGMGVPVPEKLIEVLKQLKVKNSEKEENKDDEN